MIQGIACHLGIHGLFGLDGTLEQLMMGLEGIPIILLIGKDTLRLDALTQAIIADCIDNLLTMFFLGDNPSNQLIHGRDIPLFLVQCLARHHGLANRRGRLS